MSVTPYDRAQFIYTPGGEVPAVRVSAELFRGAQRSGLLGRGTMRITQPFWSEQARGAILEQGTISTLTLEVFPFRHVDYPQAFALSFLSAADAVTFLAWYPELAL